MTRTLVMFGATWCAPCKRTKPLAMEAAAAAGFEFEYVDVEYGDDRATGVTAVPTLRVYEVDGHDEYVVAEHRGGATRAQLDKLMAP